MLSSISDSQNRTPVIKPQISISPPAIGVESSIASQVWNILVEADTAFIPPLSMRTSGTQTGLKSTLAAQSAGTIAYFESIPHQHIITASPATRAETLAGFLSFRPGFHLPNVPKMKPYHYVTTVIVRPAFRGNRVTQRMYENLLATARELNQGVATRTWATNEAHIRLLHQLGFAEIHRIPDDRGPGIDTVYFAKDI